jgi:hypothetical protein
MDYWYKLVSAVPKNESKTLLWQEKYVYRTQFFAALSVPFGILLNLMVAYISFVKKGIVGNYKFFLGNLAIGEILFHCSLFVWEVGYFAPLIFNGPIVYTPFWCTILICWGEALGVIFMNALPLIFINRYIIIVLNKNDFFTKRKIFFMCLFTYWPVLYPILYSAFPMRMVLYETNFCGHIYYFPFIREFMLIPTGVLVLASTFCVIKLFLHLHRHMKTVSTIADQSKLKDERSLLFTVLFQGVSPLLNCVCIVFQKISIILFRSSLIFSNPVLVFGVLIDLPLIIDMLFMWNPVFDALLTLFCVKRYRRAVFGWFNRKSPQVHAVEPRSPHHDQLRNGRILAQ